MLIFLIVGMTPTTMEFIVTRLFLGGLGLNVNEKRDTTMNEIVSGFQLQHWIEMKNELFFWLLELFTNNRISGHKVTTQAKASCEIVTANQPDIMEGINGRLEPKCGEIQSKIMSNSTLTSIRSTQLYHYLTEPQLKLGLQVTCSNPCFVSRFLFALRKLFKKSSNDRAIIWSGRIVPKGGFIPLDSNNRLSVLCDYWILIQNKELG